MAESTLPMGAGQGVPGREAPTVTEEKALGEDYFLVLPCRRARPGPVRIVSPRLVGNGQVGMFLFHHSQQHLSFLIKCRFALVLPCPHCPSSFSRESSLETTPGRECPSQALLPWLHALSSLQPQVETSRVNKLSRIWTGEAPEPATVEVHALQTLRTNSVC